MPHLVPTNETAHALAKTYSCNRALVYLTTEEVIEGFASNLLQPPAALTGAAPPGPARRSGPADLGVLPAQPPAVPAPVEQPAPDARSSNTCAVVRTAQNSPSRLATLTRCTASAE